MSGSTPTNNQAVMFEQQQAQQAQQKEADRQARLSQGQTLIDQIFSGSPVMGTRKQNFDWSGFKPPGSVGAAATMAPAGVPAGYTAVQVPGKGGGGGGGAGVSQYIANPMSGQGGPGPQGGAQNPWMENPAYTAGGGGAGGGGGTWALRGPDGKIYNPGDPLSVTSQYDTGQRTGGFNDAFYNKYKQKILDYYNPQEAKQYGEARRDTTYALNDRGLLASSAAADATGELGYQDALARAQIVSNANTQTGQLQDQIQANKEALISQLYATEDPTLTANLAQSSANASALKDPTLTPTAAFFTPVISGVGSAVSGLGYGPLYGQQGYNQQQQGGTVANAGQSRGVLKG